MQFLSRKLDNGLDIIAECNPDAYSVAIAFFVNAGARDEEASISGVSHFLEHMVFKGTNKRSAADVNRELDEIGSHSNAFTSEEQTVFYLAVVPDYQSHATELSSDILRPALRDEDFDTEKKVIIEEILKYDDQPPFGAHERCMAAYFGAHPLGQNVLGSVDSVSALNSSQMRDYFDVRYSPGNITVAATGRVDFDKLVADVTEYCGTWQHRPVTRDVRMPKPHHATQILHRPNTTQQYVVQIACGPAADDDDRFAQRLLASIFGDDTGSRLFWSLIDTGLAEFAGSCAYEFEGCGVTMTYLSCQPEQVGDNLRRLRVLQHELRSVGVTEDELEIAKNKVCSQIVRHAERPVNRLFSVGNAWLQRKRYQTLQESVAAYRAVSREDIRRVCDKYPIDQCATTLAGPLTEVPSWDVEV